MGLDRFSSRVDTFVGWFIAGYMLFLAGLFIVLACLPTRMLWPGPAKPPDLPIWWVRVGLLATAGVGCFGAYCGRSFGAPRSHRKILEEINRRLATLAEEQK